MTVKCPHCEKRMNIPDVVLRSAEAYGGGGHHIRCNKCNGMVKIHSSVSVRVEVVGKSNKTVDDWGG